MNRMQKFSLISVSLQVMGIFVGVETGVYSFASLVLSIHAIFQILLLSFEDRINGKAEAGE